MRRGTKLLLGITVALVTAAALHVTVGERFRDHALRYRGYGGCGSHWNRLDRHFQEKPAQPAPERIQ